MAENECLHRGRVHTRGGGEIVVYNCGLAEIGTCTITDLGLKKSGVPLAVCATCARRTSGELAVRLNALAAARMTKQVAVIIPCHNYGKYLAQCLASVMSQTHRPTEVVVVDDAGDDAALVQRLCEQHGVRYIRAEHQHVYLARKTGLDATVSPYIVFLDADDYLAHTYLAECVEAMQWDATVGVVTSDLTQFGDATGVIHHDEINIERDNWIHAGSMVRRVVLTACGAYDQPTPARQSHADWYVWRHLLRHGWRVGRIKTPSYFYRRHGGSMLRGMVTANVPYYNWASLGVEPITLVLPLSGREQYWPRMAEWVAMQPRITDVLVIDSSSNLEFRRKVKTWLSSLDVRSTKYVSQPASNGLADKDRWADREAYYSVQNTMPRIYGPMRESVTTEFMMIVEDDVLPPVSAVESLLHNMAPGVAAVSGVVPSRFSTGLAIARAEMSSPGLKLGGTGVQPLAASGFGCLLLRRSAMLAAPPFNSGGCGDFDTEFCKSVTANSWTWLLDWSVACQHGAPLEMIEPDPGLAPWEQGYLGGSLPECSNRQSRQGSVLCNIGCPSMRREPVSVFACAKHGQVTLGKRRSDLKYCVECPDCDELVQLTTTTC